MLCYGEGHLVTFSYLVLFSAALCDMMVCHAVVIDIVLPHILKSIHENVEKIQSYKKQITLKPYE